MASAHSIGDHETGQPATRTQIHQPGRTPRRQPQGDGDEPLGVPELWLEWTGPQEPKGAGLPQQFVQEGGGVVPLLGAGHRRRVSPRAR